MKDNEELMDEEESVQDELVDEADPLDRGGNDGHLPDHADHHGSSRGQNFSDVAFWRKLVYHTQP